MAALFAGKVARKWGGVREGRLGSRREQIILVIKAKIQRSTGGEIGGNLKVGGEREEEETTKIREMGRRVMPLSTFRLDQGNDRTPSENLDNHKLIMKICHGR